MNIIAVADLHGYLPTIPECDILVVAGDVCPIDNHQSHFQRIWLKRRFTDWLNEVPAKEIVGLAGNHDFVLESEKSLGYDLPWHYLKDSSVTLFGKKFYGYPWVPNLKRWAFYADEPTLQDKARNIPNDVDVLVTHGPPRGIGDAVSYCEHVGDEALRDRMLSSYITKPEVHIFGHIHEGYGMHKHEGAPCTKFIGASIMDTDYNPTRLPIRITLK